MTLTKLALLFATVGCAFSAVGQQVIGTSIVWNSSGTIQTYSSTDLDYIATAYYDAYTEGYLFQDSTLARSGSAYSGSTPSAYGYMTMPATPDAVYQLETDHYLVAFYAYYSGGATYYSNPYGFGMISNQDDYGMPTGTAFGPSGAPVYVSTQYVYLGTTAVAVLNVPAIPTYTPPDLSYLNEADGLSMMSRQERELRVRNWDAAIIAAIAANEERRQQDAQYVYPAYLSLVRDCRANGDSSIPTVSYVRYRYYQVFDNKGGVWDKFLRPIAIKETVIPTGGYSVVGNGVWDNSKLTRNSVAEDVLTVGGFPVSNPDGAALQQFFAVGAGTPFAGGNVALQIKDRISSRQGVYGTLSNVYKSSQVSINGDGGPRVQACP